MLTAAVIILPHAGGATARTCLPISVTPRQAKTALATLQEISAAAEKEHIARIVQLTKGNRSKAAEILGISRKTLWEKINAYRLDFERGLRNNNQYY